MGAENLHDQKNRKEIYPGKLRRGGTCDPIGVEIYTTCHKEYGRSVCGSGENDLGNLFSLPFLRIDKIPLTYSRISKYDAGKKMRPEPHEPCDFREQEIPKFATCKHRVYLRRDMGGRILQCQPPSGNKGRKS